MFEIGFLIAVMLLAIAGILDAIKIESQRKEMYALHVRIEVLTSEVRQLKYNQKWTGHNG